MLARLVGTGVVIGILVWLIFSPNEGPKVLHPQSPARPEEKKKEKEKRKKEILRKIEEERKRQEERKIEVLRKSGVQEYEKFGTGFVFIYNATGSQEDDDIRLGSDKDEEQLLNLFEKKLGFTVVKNDVDLNKQQLIAHVEKASSRFEKGEHFCCLFFIMAHGEKRKIKCAGTEHIKLEEIYEKFYTKKPGIPKVGFVQACRGKRIEKATATETDSSRPKQADFMVCYASAPDHVAYRDPKRGSWFIQEIVKTFGHNYQKEHVMDMMNIVIENINGMSTEKGEKQMANLRGQLPKHLFLQKKTF